jgi:ferredoxin
MVEVKKVQSLYFSPTGNTKKIIEAVSEGLSIPHSTPIDITSKRSRETWPGEVEGDLLLVGVPVWHSTFPAVVLPTLKKLKGEGRYAVPVAVCGHAKFGACLPQVAGILKKQGFKIVAAANFIGEHSYATDESPIGRGRPDDRDLWKAAQFGRRIISKLKTYATEVVSLWRDNAYVQIYAEGSISTQGSMLFESYHPLIYVVVSPDVRERCGSCGNCGEVCPTGAMDADAHVINEAVCTRCWACVLKCPQGLLHKSRARRRETSPQPSGTVPIQAHAAGISSSA